MTYGLLNKTKYELLKLFPKKTFSNIVGKWAAIPFPGPFARLQSQVFCSIASLNRDEIEAPVDSFATLDALFTRRIKPSSRTIASDPDLVLCPADGRLESAGAINETTLIQAKGLTYDLGGLLEDEAKRDVFRNGTFITVYLSPHDYHRVHFPVSGEVTTYRHIPGEFFPVGNFSRRYVPGLYARNERVITYVKTPAGMVAVIMVAAMGVGNMTLSYLPSATDSEPRPIPCAAGQELGIFHLGSTVVMLFEEGIIQRFDFEEQQLMTMGIPLGRLGA
ncbi:phosphatidylserine decarboxylase [Myxococcota bacterium]|nr:phosphatidylserine decarboxylase [Myxococcota bacterium]MBU1536446.1 phosphatidylserine decarboxylase [Myxococcota bacterium]